VTAQFDTTAVSTSSDQQQLHEPDCDSFWTPLTGYVSDSSTLLLARFKAMCTTITSWRHHGSLGGFYILFSIIYLSRFSTCATKIHWNSLFLVLRYLKTTIETPFLLKVTNNDQRSQRPAFTSNQRLQQPVSTPTASTATSFSLKFATTSCRSTTTSWPATSPITTCSSTSKLIQSSSTYNYLVAINDHNHRVVIYETIILSPQLQLQLLRGHRRAQPLRDHLRDHHLEPAVAVTTTSWSSTSRSTTCSSPLVAPAHQGFANRLLVHPHLRAGLRRLLHPHLLIKNLRSDFLVALHSLNQQSGVCGESGP